MNAVKTMVLRALNAQGYVLLKASDPRLASPAPPVAPAPQTAASNPMTCAPGPASFDADFQNVLARVHRVSSIPAAKAYTIYSAVRHVADRKIPGDIVDCGEADLGAVLVAAACLASMKDFTRNVVLYDVTGDPAHGAELSLPAWGGGAYHFEREPHGVQPDKQLSSPALSHFEAIGFPASHVRLLRYPVNSLDFAPAVSFLTATALGYAANRAAVGRLLSRVPPGGVVGADINRVASRDAVEDAIAEGGYACQLWRVSDTYRIGVRS